MDSRPLLGDEGIALGAIDAGISGAYSYPGTPATEIFEFVERETRSNSNPLQGGVHRVWSANEKVALEEALGMSYAGRRALVSFKHVGLNVAADPFMNSAVTGVHGGLVLAVADDPGMHSSQNEQDSRVFANFALLPCLEPANGQECYDMTQAAYDLSERFGLPVALRLVTRLAHSRSNVTPTTRRDPNALNPTPNPRNWTLLPMNARRSYASLTNKQQDLLRWSETCSWNSLHLNPNGGRVGVIASGVAINYFLESYSDDEPLPPYLRIGAYPIPKALIEQLFDHVDSVIILEDGYPYIESSLMGVLGTPKGVTIKGRLDGTLPRTGELNPDLVRQGLGKAPLPKQSPPDFSLPGRPPCLCNGCPHIDSYRAIQVILDENPGTRVFGDIGCYTLAALPPYNACHSCVDMGASISMAMGAAQAGMWPVLATIGDSTFIHSGMTPLIDAAAQDLNMTVFILDNATVAMTGGQATMASGGSLEQVVKGLGVSADHVHVLRAHPKAHDENVALIRREVAHKGLSVIIPVRECIQTIKKK